MKKIYLASTLIGMTLCGTGYADEITMLKKIVALQQQMIQNLRAEVQEVRDLVGTAQATANSGVEKANSAQATANSGVEKANAAQSHASRANNRIEALPKDILDVHTSMGHAVSTRAEQHIIANIENHRASISGAVATRAEQHIFHNLKKHIRDFIDMRITLNGCHENEVQTGHRYNGHEGAFSYCLYFK